jgi:hypothetical protein
MVLVEIVEGTSTATATAQSFYDYVGIVGYGNVTPLQCGANAVVRTHTSLSEIATLYGDERGLLPVSGDGTDDQYYTKSAILKDAELVFKQNSKARIKVVQCCATVGASSPQVIDTTVDPTWEDTITVAAGNSIAVGSLRISDGTNYLNEGTDYNVDYSNGTVNFLLENKYLDVLTATWSEITAAQIETALSKLDSVNVNLVFGAEIYTNELLVKIAEHTADVENSKPRNVILPCKYLDSVSNMTALATAISTKRASIWSHRCGFEGTRIPADSAVPGNDALEYRNPAAMAAGLLSAGYPADSIVGNAINGSNFYGEWTLTEIGEAGSSGMLEKYVNYFGRLSNGAIIPYTNYTADQTATVNNRHIDQSRTWVYLRDQTLNAVGPLVGNVRTNKPGIETLYDVCNKIVLEASKNGGVTDPTEYFRRTGTPSVRIELYDIYNSPLPWEPEWITTVEETEISRKILIEIYYNFEPMAQEIFITLTPK